MESQELRQRMVAMAGTEPSLGPGHPCSGGHRAAQRPASLRVR